MNYLDQLISDCKKAKAAIPLRSFIMKDIGELKGIKNVIYKIDQIEGCYEQAFNKYKEFKKSKQVACAKENQPSPCMYIGSSTSNNLTRRIREHLGEGNKKTYALHLKEWFGTNGFEITIMEFEPSLPRRIIQLIEDDYAYKAIPAFGKRGPNNK